MKTLICVEQPPIYITNLPSCKPRSPTTLHPRTWKVHAKAKGFSRTQAKVQDGKITSTETITRSKSFERKFGGDDDDKIPEVVFERMIVRILFYVGVPMVIGIAFLLVFNVAKEQHLWDVPLWLPLLTTFLTFGASALGIAYGTLSTSLDPEKKGSILGFEEAQKNWVEMWEEGDDDESRR
ncbi:Uncharacterized protein PAM68-like [Camellia lanceoleosa]|uniref:Uncharacterized protein PAM68-like n=1 Tax=Camellia lanceoleosa TaxID=1840588 RepID=A0ACC0H333_9ERIC|nr:Uncharacterized protein PAM68-like [Camellia lanceoleosa]